MTWLVHVLCLVFQSTCQSLQFSHLKKRQLETNDVLFPLGSSYHLGSIRPTDASLHSLMPLNKARSSSVFTSAISIHDSSWRSQAFGTVPSDRKSSIRNECDLKQFNCFQCALLCFFFFIFPLQNEVWIKNTDEVTWQWVEYIRFKM